MISLSFRHSKLYTPFGVVDLAEDCREDPGGLSTFARNAVRRHVNVSSMPCNSLLRPQISPDSSLLHSTIAMFGRTSVLLCVLFVFAKLEVSNTTRRTLLAMNLTNFRDDLYAKMRADVVEQMKKFRAELLEKKNALFAQTEAGMRQCWQKIEVKKSNATTTCYDNLRADSSKKGELMVADAQKKAENLKKKLRAQYEKEFKEGVHKKMADLRVSVRGVVDELKRTPNAITVALTNALKKGGLDALADAGKVRRQFEQPLSLFLMISASFVYVFVTGFSIYLCRNCVEPEGITEKDAETGEKKRRKKEKN